MRCVVEVRYSDFLIGRTQDILYLETILLIGVIGYIMPGRHIRRPFPLRAFLPMSLTQRIDKVDFPSGFGRAAPMDCVLFQISPEAGSEADEEMK